ncbi:MULTISPECIES: aromatic ring-hydroxylating dioxygenase subunit alpha [unclassified Cupriavidus]|uniref:aromatic ring-hydroxylating dioxygenase subunit alpha n=1 Tax=unclassified Cupriavidus TaxID=2640874 RepID=UPI000688927D|nr:MULTISPECIES: aromatic ring-hydroxylating dioxygenase subunit alpha [unclassified Cupriavidus]MBP0627643.1 aromatic ring-hydroxylating dioxygenase subunit alpha [Cupriavidus sp. AcVe19-1a]
MNAVITQVKGPAAMKQGADRFPRNAWYVGLWAHELPAGKLVPQTILCEPVVFFRKEDGSAAAIVDRCSHRFAPLSMGKLLPGDRVQCPYHGLEFGATGACVKNPHGNCTVPNAAHLRSFPVVEKHGFVWIWMGDRVADPGLIPDYSCLDTSPAAHVTTPGYLKIAAHYELIVDNLLDLSHTTYVHEGILGTAGTVVADIGVEQRGDVVVVSRPSKDAETPGMLKMLSGLERGDQWSTISWYAPSNLILEYGVSKVGEPKEKGTGYFALHLLTPENERSTHYRYSAVRWNVMTEGEETNEEIREKIGKLRTFAFAEQDAPIIEAQQRRMDESPTPLTPTLLAIDAGPMRYRRVLDRLLQQERVANEVDGDTRKAS